jgi:hypothetical protein
MSSEDAWLHNQYEPGDNRPLTGNPVHIDNVLKKIQEECNQKLQEIEAEKVNNV